MQTKHQTDMKHKLAHLTEIQNIYRDQPNYMEDVADQLDSHHVAHHLLADNK